MTFSSSIETAVGAATPVLEVSNKIGSVSTSEQGEPCRSLPRGVAKELLQAWLIRGEGADALDQWIFWNNSPSRHVPLNSITQFIPETLYSMLSKDHRLRSSVDKILRSKFSWKEPVAWNPQDPLWEISLLRPSQFQRLAFLAAVLSMREVIAKIIDGSVVRKLRQEIGEDIIEFGLLSGSLSKYSLPSINEALPLLDDPIAMIKKRAVILIEYAFSSKERGVQERIASKFPGSFVEGIEAGPSPLARATEEMLCKLWKEASSWL